MSNNQNKKIDWQEIVRGKAAVFIDAANILYSQKTLDFRIDYKKLKDYLSGNLDTSGFYYYTGKVGKFEKQLRFIKHISRELLERTKYIDLRKLKDFIKFEE